MGQLSHDVVPGFSANFAAGHSSHDVEPTEPAYVPIEPGGVVWWVEGGLYVYDVDAIEGAKSECI